MKEHPDYKYRPRRKPKNGVKTKETTSRYPYGLPSLEANHLHPSAMHLNAAHGQPMPNFNRSPFFPPELLSPSSASGIDGKSPTERAELNYSRLLFASQMPSLHLGFAAMAHPSLHSVQIPWYHYGMTDPAVFNPLNHRTAIDHPALSISPSANQKMRSATQSAEETVRPSSSPSQSPSCCNMDEDRTSSPTINESDKSPRADEDRVPSPASSEPFNRPASAGALSCTSITDCRHNRTTSSTGAATSGGSSAFAAAAAAAAAASSSLMSTSILPFPYGPYLPATCGIGCNCPVSVVSHHHDHHHPRHANGEHNRSARPCPLSTVL